MDSILNTVKKMLGIDSEYEHFDTDIIININSAFNTLQQLGVGPSEGFSISDYSSNWSDFIGDTQKLEMVKQYVYLKCKIVFDPSLTTSINETYKEIIKELEWRLNVQVETGGN